MIELAKTGNHDGGIYYLSDDKARFIYIWDGCEVPFEIEVARIENALRQDTPMAIWMLGAGVGGHVEWYKFLTERTAEQPEPTKHPADYDWFINLMKT